MKQLFFTSTLIFSALLVVRCASNEPLNDRSQNKRGIKPPLEGIDVARDEFSFDASQDQQILTKEGTVISIPANSLVDKKGKLIKGQVKLKYRSIDTPTEVIASGIPLTYDSAGVSHDFISAGMFEIQAYQKGKELDIKKGSSIQVDFASYKNGNEFSFYKINEKTGEWTFKGKTEPKPNVGKITRLKQFSDDNLVEFEVDYSAYPELKAFNGLKWICINEEGVDNPTKNSWMEKEYWYDIDFKSIDEKTGIYEVTLSNNKKTNRFKVSPYLMENETNADRIKALATVNEAIQARKEIEQRIQLEADITRSFSISSFGTYNWDTIEKRIAEGVLASINASFQIDNKPVNEDMHVYLLSGKKGILSKVTKRWEKLVYDPNEDNKLLIIMADNYAALGSANDFLKAKNKADFEFSLRKVAKKIKTIQDLENLLAKK